MNKTSKSDALASIAGLQNPEESLPRDFVGSRGDGECSITTPTEVSLNLSFDEICLYARSIKASDIHFSVNNPIIIRQNSFLHPVTSDKLEPKHNEAFINNILNEDQKNIFHNTGGIEIVHTIPGGGRYRVATMKQRFGWDITVRIIPMTIWPFNESGLPTACEGLTKWAQGMVLVTGPAGCGKSTTLSVLVEMINQSREDHIITIENPIEVVYEPKKCQITQREVGMHTLSQHNALRAALREDPDILVVSELRDLQSIQLAVTAAETGHLVFGTMNTINAAQTVSRLIDSFPPEDQDVVRNMISESLRGVICQQLIPTPDGQNVVAAFEVMIVTQAISNMIRENKVGQITNAISTGRNAGMVLLDHSLTYLVQNGYISGQEAYNRSVAKTSFKQYIE